MRRLVAIAVLLVCSAHAHAQTGPRTGGPAPGDTKGTQLAVDLSLAGNLARGVADRDLISGRGGITYWRGPWGLFVQPYYMFGDVKVSPVAPRVTTDDERYLRLLTFYTFNDPLFGYGVVAADHSLRRHIGRRILFGGGTGATLVNRPGVTLLTAVGLLGEIGHYDGATLPDMTMVPASDRKLARTSLRLYGRYRLPSNRLALVHDIYLIPNVRDLHDLRAMVSASLEIPIHWGFSARVQVDATYEQYIVPGTQHSDVAITFGAGYKNEWKRR